MNKLTRRDFTKIATATGVTTALGRNRVLGANRPRSPRLHRRWAIAATRCSTPSWPHKDAEVVAVCDLYQPYLDFAAQEDRRAARSSSTTTAGCSSARTSTPSSSTRPTTGTRCRPSTPARPARTSTSKSRSRSASRGAQDGRGRAQAQPRHAGRPPAPFGADLQRGRRARPQRRHRQSHASSAPFTSRTNGPRASATRPTRRRPRTSTGTPGSAPRPSVAYNKNRTFYRFRWFYDYSGGQLTNFGVHYLDVIHWALGQDAPLAVTAMGGKCAIDDNREIPDTLEVIWTFPGNTLVTFSQFNASAAPGWAKQRRDRVPRHQGNALSVEQRLRGRPRQLSRPTSSPRARRSTAPSSAATATGAKPMIEPAKAEGQRRHGAARAQLPRLRRSRASCNCDIETGHRGTSARLLGNIASQDPSYLEWDAKAERFTNNTAANKLLSYEYRAPYKLPS